MRGVDCRRRSLQFGCGQDWSLTCSGAGGLDLSMKSCHHHSGYAQIPSPIQNSLELHVDCTGTSLSRVCTGGAGDGRPNWNNSKFHASLILSVWNATNGISSKMKQGCRLNISSNKSINRLSTKKNGLWSFFVVLPFAWKGNAYQQSIALICNFWSPKPTTFPWKRQKKLLEIHSY